MEGIIVKSTGSWYDVLLPDDSTVQAKAAGSLRLKGSKNTNPVAVGDRVVMQHAEGKQMADAVPVIVEVLPRNNYLIRRSVNLSRQEHVLAANIDAVLVVVSISQPRTSTGFIDRILCTCEAYKIEPVLIINKTDLHNADDREYAQALGRLYGQIGYKVVFTSAISGEGIAELESLTSHRTVLFTGHSGCGKSSLINAIDPSLNIRIGSISNVHNKGKHTTTFAQLHTMKNGGRIIDSPGIKEFGVIDLDKHEVGLYFREFFELLPRCKFSDCLHQNEPGCAVKEALKQGLVAQSRYNSYLGIVLSEDLLADWEK